MRDKKYRNRLTKVQILAYEHTLRNRKRCFYYTQIAGNYVIIAGNFVCRHSHANWLKNGSKKDDWVKQVFP